MITINGNDTDISPGETVMQVADRLGIAIPRMCHREELSTFTSCMVCQVLNQTSGTMLPACSIPAADGMVIDTDGESVVLARQTAIELLLSEHLGDCEGPCTVFCPAGMDIPLMIRQIADGAFADALRTVKADIALPAVLGRVCSAPCENACRRSYHDETVSICKLKRFVADLDLDLESPWLPETQPSSGKRVAVVGGGPMGLAAAWHLRVGGHEVTLFDDQDSLGGGLRSTMKVGKLDPAVLDKEISVILSLGISTKLGTTLGVDLHLPDLIESFDAVLMGFQPRSLEDAKATGLPTDARGVAADRTTYATTVESIFARPGLATKSTMSIRAVAAGKNMARSVTAFLGSTARRTPLFNSVFGKPSPTETACFMRDTSTRPQHRADDGLMATDAVAESKRCLHCDCRGKDACSLRDLATDLGAKQRRFPAEDRPDFTISQPMNGVVFEPGKCIRCGICVRICEANNLENGFTFIERGYDVRVGTPFDQPIPDAHRDVVLQCVTDCPTGALAVRE
jgi:ferredoxin